MPEITIHSVDHDTAKLNAVIAWTWPGDENYQFLVVPLKDWNRQAEFESRRNPDQKHHLATAAYFLMKLDVIPMDPAYLSPVDNTPVPQYE